MEALDFRSLRSVTVDAGDAPSVAAGCPRASLLGPSASAGPRIPRRPLTEGKEWCRSSPTPRRSLLAAAAARPDLSVLPAPETLRLKGAALERTLKALLGRGLIAEAPMTGRTKRSKWAGPDADAADRRRLIITPAGLEAIGVESAQAGAGTADAVPEQRAHPETQRARPGGKLGVLLDAVSRPEGATLEDLTAASGWLPHTTRAAITRLRQRGYDVRIATMGTRRAYHLVPAV